MTDITKDPKDVIRKIDYATMHCSTCGNFRMLQCNGYPDHPDTKTPPCDLWLPTDYFDGVGSFPMYRVINAPIVPCDRCQGTGRKRWKHGESDHHSSGSETECPWCKGAGTVREWH